MDELKPCPFCGGRAEQFIRYMPDNTNYYYIMCSKCKASSNEFFLMMDMKDYRNPLKHGIGGLTMIWHYPTLQDDGWHPSKDNAWPVSGAYHILQMKETPNSLYSYNDDDFIVAYYNNLLECWETESCMDYIEWEDVNRWCVLIDKDGNPVKDMED